MAGDVRAWPVEAGDKTQRDRVSAGSKYDRYGRGRCLRCLALAAVVAASLLMLAAAIVMAAPRFADCAAAAAGATSGRRQRPVAGFRNAAPMETLRRKEWTLLP